jgi:hypothetical protein
MDVTRPDVELHIGELVLEGVAAGDRGAVAEALRAELARLVAEGGVPAAWSAGGGAARLDGGSFPLQPGASAAQLGAQVARAVAGGGAR